MHLYIYGKVFYLNLIIYLIRKHRYIYVSDRSVDIDSNFDFKFVKFSLLIDSGISIIQLLDEKNYLLSVLVLQRKFARYSQKKI